MTHPNLLRLQHSKVNYFKSPISYKDYFLKRWTPNHNNFSSRTIVIRDNLNNGLDSTTTPSNNNRKTDKTSTNKNSSCLLQNIIKEYGLFFNIPYEAPFNKFHWPNFSSAKFVQLIHIRHPWNVNETAQLFVCPSQSEESSPKNIPSLRRKIQ